jgi:hypothetical protein
MADSQDQSLLEALLDSWDRNNTILLNLLRALPERGLEAKAMQDSPSIAQLFAHIHYALCRRRHNAYNAAFRIMPN